MHLCRILLVEDDLILNHDLGQSLEEFGYTVRSIYCGKTAFDAIDRHEHFLALVTDIDLGRGADGVDVARYARAFYPHLPVVFTSGQADARHASHGVVRSEFVPKPFQASEIAEALARAIRAEAD